MPRLVVDAETHDTDPDAALRALADLSLYPQAAEEIRSLTVREEQDGTLFSEWEVTFRGGLIRWSQRDVVDIDSRRIDFDQVEGDSEVWNGSWIVEPGRVRFEVEYDMGIPALADQLNPLAARALYDVIVAVIQGRVGPDARIVTPPPN
jgi:ribosome-associated toxin RatA of RatAB toxin-antitoxin module